MPFQPRSLAFTLFLALVVALPAFGIDMGLPALAGIGRSLGVSAARAGLTVSLFMAGFAATPLVYGPASDRYGRKPVLLVAAALFAAGAGGCALAPSLPALLAWRVVQGAGAGAGMTMALAIIRDLFEGEAARARISHVANASMVVPMLAPTAGAGLLAIGGWRLIYAVLAAVGGVLLLAVALGFAESARAGPAGRPSPAVLVRGYGRVLAHPACMGHVLVNAAAFGALFAYVSGSPLYLIGVAGLSQRAYGLVFALTSAAIMAGTWLNGRLSASGALPGERVLAGGLALANVTATLLLALTLGGGASLALIVPVVMVGCFAFGLIAPNAVHAAMQPMPEIAGAVGAVVGTAQMVAGAAVSALVAGLDDGRSALAMTGTMALCSLAASAAYLLVTRRAGRLRYGW